MIHRPDFVPGVCLLSGMGFSNTSLEFSGKGRFWFSYSITKVAVLLLYACPSNYTETVCQDLVYIYDDTKASVPLLIPKVKLSGWWENR